MKLIIKPGNDTFETKLSTMGYQRVWSEHGVAIIAAFRELTGLDFQVTTMTARVQAGENGNAGNPNRHQAVMLPSLHGTEDQAIVIVHELAHRILLENNINPQAIGLDNADTSKRINQLLTIDSAS